MGTPEDAAAEKYFIPPTLTKMLEEGMLDPYPLPDAVDEVKRVFREWIRNVGLPQYHSFDRDGNTFNTTESIQQLLIILIDEP